MLRRDIVNIVNELLATIDFDINAQVDVKEMYNLIFSYCKEHKIAPRKNTYHINNGVLVINGQNIERIQPLIRVPFSEEGYYWEKRILARQENDF